MHHKQWDITHKPEHTNKCKTHDDSPKYGARLLLTTVFKKIIYIMLNNYKDMNI
jgi:hypothetical protein